MRKRDLRVIFTVSGGWAGRPLTPRSIGYDSTYELDGGWISANCSATQWNPTRHEGVLNLNDGVTAIGGGQSTDYSPFYDRNDVTGVDLSQSKIMTIGDYTFYGCTGLETIDIPSTVNEIGDYAFDCENLTAVICRATVPPALGSHNFTNENDFLYVPEGSVEAYQNDEDWSGAFLRIYPIGYVQHTIRYNAETAVSGNWVADNTDTGLNEFDEETGDGVLYLNTDINTIGGSASTDDSPFYNKTDLVSVDLDDSGITGIGHSAFRGCTSLTSFDIPSGQTEIGGYAFGGCTSLTSIVIPEGIVRLRGSVFRDCSSLASVSFPNTLTNIGGNSFRGTALTSVTIPSGVTLIDPYAFDCASLTTVTCNATTPPVLESNNFTATGDTLYVPYASLEAYENDTDWSSAFTSIRPIGYTYITVGAGEHGSATGSGWYQVDAYVIITATADEHYHFDRWNDGNTSNPRAIIVGSTDTTYTASFAVDEFTLIATGDAHTTVTGSGTYPYGTEVQITATPAEHYHFTSWSDGDTTNPRTVTVTGNMTLSATSAINTYTITVSTGQHGTASGSGTYPYGSFVQISATADSDYHFSQWNDGNTDNPRTITVTADATYTASFESDAFTVTITGDAHTTVTGSGSYPYGTQVQISATPDEHYHFVAWSDGDTNATRTITVTGNITLSASSAVNTYTITVNAGQHGSASGSGTYGYGTQVQISATADTYYRFTAWNDGNTDNPRTVTVTGNATYTASFEAAVQSNVIRYNAGSAVSGNWVTNNTDTTKNTYDSVTGDGVLYLNSGVTSIGGGQSTDYSPFYNKTNLYSADLSNSGLTTVGSRTFYSCSGLTSVQLPSGMTSMGSNVFRSCSSLTSVNIPVGITAIQDVCFGDCTSLSSVVLPEGLTTINLGAFTRDTALTAIELPSSITSIGQSSFNCSNLTSVTCKATTPPTLNMNGSTPNFPASNDTLYVPYASLSLYQSSNIWSGAFASIRPNGYSYITVTAGANGSASGSGWYGIGITAIITATPDTGYHFSQWNDGNTDNPRSVTVGSTDVTYTASFEGGVQLNEIRYNASTAVSGNWVTNNTDTTKNTYDSVTGNGVLYLNAGVTAIGGGQSTDNSPFYGKTDLKSVDLLGSGLTSLSSSGFRGCTGLEELTIPSTVTYIGYNVFDNCTSLGTVTCYATTPPTLYSDFPAISDVLYVPYLSLSSYKNHNTWGNAFPYIYSIGFNRRAIRYNAGTPATGDWVTSYTHTDLNTYNSQTGNGILYLVGDEWGGDVTSIGSTPDYAPFYQKTDLVAIDMSDSVITEIGDWGFFGCTNLTNVTLPSTLTGVHGFSGCTSLTSITLPSGLTHIGDFAFAATGLTSINIPSGVTLIGNSAFQECSSLTSITLPSTLNWLGDGVVTNQGVFKNCTSLVSVIGLEDTNIDTIVAETFQGCTSLTSITLPSSLTEIKASAFDCANLTTVTCLATTPPTLASGNFTASDDTLKVPSASVSAYQSATAWANAFTTITSI